MTSNIGTQIFKKNEQIGFGSDGSKKNFKAIEEKIMKDVKNHFKIEFINRLDQIIFFSPLQTQSLIRITELELDKLVQSLTNKGINLTYNKEVAKFLAEHNTDEKGVRAIKKSIRDLIEGPLSNKILEGKIEAGNTMHLALKNGIIELT